MMKPPILLSKETLKAIEESADAVEFGQEIDVSGGGYMDSAAATSRVVSTKRTFFRKERPERVTFSFGEGREEKENEGAAAEKPKQTKKKGITIGQEEEQQTTTQKTTTVPLIKPPSQAEIKQRNSRIRKAAEGLVSYSDVIAASAASGENSRQRLKTLKFFFNQNGAASTTETTRESFALKAIDSSLEAASSITRRARKSMYSSSKRKRNPSTARSAANSGILLSTKVIVSTLFKEALSRFVAEDFISEDQASSWVRKYSKNRMTYTMNMRFFAASLVWIYVSFGKNDVEPTMKVDEEFAKQMKSASSRKTIDEIILIAKPVLTEAPVSYFSSESSASPSGNIIIVPEGDRNVLFTYAVWIVYNENEAYTVDSSFYEGEGVEEEEGDEGEDAEEGEEEEIWNE